MRLNELKTRGHAVPVRVVRDNARARLLLAGEHQTGDEIGIAYTGTNEQRVADLGGNRNQRHDDAVNDQTFHVEVRA